MHGTVELGGEVGNVAYDPDLDRMAVAVAGAGELAITDPATLSVTARIPLSDCTSAHGVALDASTATVFVACENTATVVAVALNPEGWSSVTPFAEQHQVRYRVVLGDEDLFERCGGYSLPHSLLIDGEQRVVKIYRGAVTRATVEKDIEALKKSS